MSTDTVTIYRVSLPLSLMCFFTASMGILPSCGISQPLRLLPHLSFQRPQRSAPPYLTGSAGSDHRDGDIVPDVADELYVKAPIGPVLINAVQEDLPGATPCAIRARPEAAGSDIQERSGPGSGHRSPCPIG
jgi:hypothetical protein